MLVYLNYRELLKGNLTIEGYKTIKTKNKARNSYYFTLRKAGYQSLEKQDKTQAIIDSLLTVLQMYNFSHIYAALSL